MPKINKSYIKLLLLSLKPNSSGYTLIESLVALVVVGILITSVAPMLALTTASRVQSRRVDLATQALRAYVDGVRGGALPIPQRFVKDPPTPFTGPDYGFTPSSSLGSYTSNSDPGTLIDTNGNGFDVDDPQDLVIQAIRPLAFCTPVCTANTPTEIATAGAQGFRMAVRVYRADSFSGGAVPSGTEQTATFVGSIGSRANPLATASVEVYPSSNLNSIRLRP